MERLRLASDLLGKNSTETGRRITVLNMSETSPSLGSCWIMHSLLIPRNFMEVGLGCRIPRWAGRNFGQGQVAEHRDEFSWVQSIWRVRDKWGLDFFGTYMLKLGTGA
jgi:hypothetical protein